MKLPLRAVGLCAIVSLSLSLVLRPCRADQYLLVNGQMSEDVVKFDLTTGTSTLYGEYQAGANPRNLAMDSAGNLYSSLNGGNLNVVKFVPQAGTSVLATENFTTTVGGDGPGQIQFYNGDLYVAGDESRVIWQYNGTTGAFVSLFSSTMSYNIRAMAITGNTLYYEEIFQDRVRQFDLSVSPPKGSTLFTDTTNLARADNMTIGPQGSLVFANTDNALIQEFSSTGVFLGTLANLHDFDSSVTSVVDVEYSPALNEYFASANDEVFRLSANGTLLNTYTSPLLQHATGLLVVPEPDGFATACVALLGLVALVACLKIKRGRSETIVRTS